MCLVTKRSVSSASVFASAASSVLFISSTPGHSHSTSCLYTAIRLQGPSLDFHTSHPHSQFCQPCCLFCLQVSPFHSTTTSTGSPPLLWLLIKHLCNAATLLGLPDTNDTGTKLLQNTISLFTSQHSIISKKT